MPDNQITEREYNSLVSSNEEIKGVVKETNRLLQKFIISQTKTNAINKIKIKALELFRKRVIQVCMVFILSSTSLAAKYTFEAKPVIGVETKKAGD